MSFDFGYLETNGKTARLPLYAVQGEPWLEMKPAAQSNPNYYGSLVKRAQKSIRRLRAGKMDQEVLKENRAQDRALYPKHVIIGWGNVKDTAGNEVEFSAESCQQFIDALPDWLFDEIRAFASEETNFVEDPLDVGEISGN